MNSRENSQKIAIICKFSFYFDSNFIEIYRSLSLLSQALMNSWENSQKIAIICKFSFYFDSNFIEIYRSLSLLSQALMNSRENCQKICIICKFSFYFDSNFIEIYRSLNLLSQALVNSREIKLQIPTRIIHRIHSYVRYAFINGIYTMINVKRGMTDLGLQMLRQMDVDRPV